MFNTEETGNTMNENEKLASKIILAALFPIGIVLNLPTVMLLFLAIVSGIFFAISVKELFYKK